MISLASLSLALLRFLAVVVAQVVVAQAPPPRAPSMVSAKSYTMEWIIVAVCFGAALFAICRPSRRS